MGRINWTRKLRRALIVFVGTICVGMLLTATADAKKWSAAKEYKKDKTSNPAGAFSWMYGEANTPSSYKLDAFQSPAEYEAQCGAEANEFYNWGGDDSGFDFNAGKTVKAGKDPCSPRDTFVKDILYINPGFHTSAYAIIDWKSPITGAVAVSGSLKSIDSRVTGITWELDQGTTILLGPTVQSGGLTSFGPVDASVTKGESLYLEVGDGPSGEGGSDAYAVTLNITS